MWQFLFKLPEAFTPENTRLVVFPAGFLLSNFSWSITFKPYLCSPYFLRKYFGLQIHEQIVDFHRLLFFLNKCL